MADRALYLLAEFDEHTQRALARVYAALQAEGLTGRQTKDIPYHFTLGSREMGCEAELTERLRAVCAATPAIDVRLDHLGLFGLTVLFAEPNMCFELLALQNAFFPSCGHGAHPWTAHATLLLDDEPNLLRALPIAARSFEPRVARMECVSLYEFFPARLMERRALRS